MESKLQTPTPTASDMEDTKRLQSLLQDLSNKLDQGLIKCKKVPDVFEKELDFYRMKLRDYSERLFKVDPVKYGDRVIDLFWKKGVYVTFSTARNVKEGWTSIERALVSGHLQSSLEQFQIFLVLIQRQAEANKTSLDSIGFETDLLATELLSLQLNEAGKDLTKIVSHHPQEALQTWMKRVTHRCLMCMGDICRYLLEVSASVKEDRSYTLSLAKADRFYKQAFAVDEGNGAPFNQLAALAVTNTDHSLSTVFFYLKSMTCQKPFDGAKQNMRRVLERNQKKYSKFAQLKETNASEQSNNEGQLPVLSPQQETERFVTFTLELINVALFGSILGESLSDVCKQTLESLQHCLYLTYKQNEPEGATEKADTAEAQPMLDQSMALKFVTALIMVMDLSKTNETELSTLKAFMLALFTHLVTKLLTDLHCKLYGDEALESLFGEEEEMTRPPSPTPFLSEKARRKARRGLDRFKRRRKASEEDESEDESESEALRSSDEDDEVSDEESDNSSDEQDIDDDVLHSDSEESDEWDDEDDDDNVDVIIESTKEVPMAWNLVQTLGSHHLVPAFRTCLEWLMSNESLVREAASTSEVLWSRICKLLNLTRPNNNDLDQNEEVEERADELLEQLETTTLPGDDDLRGLAIFAEYLKQKNWSKETEQTKEDVGVLTMLLLVKFRNFLCSIKEVKMIKNPNNDVVKMAKTYEDVRNRNASSDSLDDQKSTDDEAEDEEDEGSSSETRSKPLDLDSKERQKAMQNMAQLWLQQEVKDLESQLRGAKKGKLFSHYTIYVIVDHLALSCHLNFVKDVVGSKQFAVIVPTAAIHMLDEMKKEDTGARNAIRWLEKHFQEGNHWLRSQRAEESKALEDQDISKKKKDRADWQRLSILECCHYFSELQGGFEEVSDAIDYKSGATLLSVKEEADPASIAVDTWQLAEAINLKVFDITDFVLSKRGVARKPKKKKG